MAINKYKPHLFVLPEDDANRQIANGFHTDPSVNVRAMQVLPTADGWEHVVRKFTKDHLSDLRRFAERRILLLVDFDEDENRLGQVQADIPEDVKDRVFVLGVWSEPEKLKSDTKKTFEQVGEELASDCANNSYSFWQHQLLIHNQSELDRMIEDIKPFLFIDS